MRFTWACQEHADRKGIEGYVQAGVAGELAPEGLRHEPAHSLPARVESVHQLGFAVTHDPSGHLHGKDHYLCTHQIRNGSAAGTRAGS